MSFSSSANSQYVFVNILWIGLWVSRIDWCRGHCEAVQHKPKNSLKTQKMHFLPVYVGKPHGHIGWAKSMPFTSINPTNPKTNPWNFGGNCSAFGDVEKLSFFESAILIIFFFAFIPIEISHNLWDTKEGTNFDTLISSKKLGGYKIMRNTVASKGLFHKMKNVVSKMNGF